MFYFTSHFIGKLRRFYEELCWQNHARTPEVAFSHRLFFNLCLANFWPDNCCSYRKKIGGYKKAIFLINFKVFNEFSSQFNWFCHNDLDLDDKFGSKMLIKWWFDHNLSWNFSLGQFNHLRLLILQIRSTWLGVQFVY